MSKVQELVQGSVAFGEMIRVHGLGVIPIVARDFPEIPPLDVLEDAMARGTVKITETSPSGEVPFLLLENSGERPIILLDGEELWGGKQNRIVNTSMVILAHSTVKIPVSCVQAGRWREERKDFEPAAAVFKARSRAVHKASVTEQVRACGAYRSDQGAVWDQVANYLAESGVESPSSDFREARQRASHRIEEFALNIRPADDQIGSIFISRDGILGVEIAGAPPLFRRLCDKITSSFAFEVLTDPDLPPTPTDSAQAWWQTILETPFSRGQSPGSGEDIRLDSQQIIGSGLFWSDTLVHFSCFPEIDATPRQSKGKVRRNPANLRRSVMSRNPVID